MSGAILVVEDEPAIQELIAVNLEHAGHTVLRASSVPQAEEHLRAALPDLVLLDCMLPGLSGISYARQLRANDPLRCTSGPYSSRMAGGSFEMSSRSGTLVCMR